MGVEIQCGRNGSQGKGSNIEVKWLKVRVPT